MLGPIHEFLWKKLLFWLEVLSVLKDTLQALTELLALQRWIKVWTAACHSDRVTIMNFTAKDLG
jgi:hypothetical protein